MSIVEKLHKAGTRVAVVYGGPGAEREVSLSSGGCVRAALAGAGLDTIDAVVPAASPEAFMEALQCDIAVMMLHGEFGEDGAAQAILERRGIAFTGSDSKTCALTMDKQACKKIFRDNNMPTPRWATASRPEEAEAAIADAGLRYPLFVKPNFRGSSVGVTRVSRPDEARAAAAKALSEDSLALVEEMVVGRELTIGWLDGRVLPSIEMAADGEFYDYHAKYQSDKTKYDCPAKLPDGMEAELGGFVSRLAGIFAVRDLCRVDIMIGESGPMILEINSLPGFTTHSLLPMAAARAGIDMASVCLSLVEMAARRAGIV